MVRQYVTGFVMLAAAALLCTVSVPSFAATAHNSQAGAAGPVNNPAKPTVNSPRVRHRHTMRRM